MDPPPPPIPPHAPAGPSTDRRPLYRADHRRIAVHIAARVMAGAEAGEARVSGATAAVLDKETVPLRALGSFELKGVPDTTDLYAIRA